MKYVIGTTNVYEKVHTYIICNRHEKNYLYILKLVLFMYLQFIKS